MNAEPQATAISPSVDFYGVLSVTNASKMDLWGHASRERGEGVRRRKIVLLQLPIPPLSAQPIRGNVPLAAGYLKLFARQRGLEEFFDIEIFAAEQGNRLGDQAIVDALCEREPWMVGLTCYLWNIDRSLWVAGELRRRRPVTRIVIGGPEVTADNDWVLDTPCLDFAVVGEGEQTFAELLSAHLDPAAQSLESIHGLLHRVAGRWVHNPPRQPMAELDPISSPYLAGILNAGDQEQLLLETIRGCVFKCKFCYYPKAYDRLYYVSREKILDNLRHARENGAREVYLLDPTLNQRRDFAEFLDVLIAGNPHGQLEYYAELRAEGVTPDHAKAMRRANFKEVEIGLQSIDPATQELMDRRNNLKAFERGVRALQAEGVRVKVDLIVGLPGDTVDSVRRGMHYLAERRLYNDIQVFQLSILPGTSFRHEAAALGLEFQSRPPYYVLRTPTLSLDDMLGLLEEAEEVFDTEFDSPPAPELYLPSADGPHAVRRLQLDAEPLPGPPPRHITHAFTLWLDTADPFGRLDQAERAVREILEDNPFSTLHVVLETAAAFPLDVFARLRTAFERPHNNYLERFYEFTPGGAFAARRIVTLLPAHAREKLDIDWIAAAREYTDLVWKEPSARRVLPTDQPGEWTWTAGPAFEPARTAPSNGVRTT